MMRPFPMDEKSLIKMLKNPMQLPETIELCHELIRSLLGTLSGLFPRLEKLELENRQLKERLDNSSSNSSLPPSKDYKKKKKKKAASSRSSGGQVGHKGHCRDLLPSEQVDTIVNCQLPESCECGGKIAFQGGYQRHQVYELPIVKLHVTEYRLEKGCCDACSRRHLGNLPSGVTWGITGPRLTAFMSHLVSTYGLSRRELKAFLEEQYDFSISLGTVFNKQKLVNAALEAPVEALLPAIKQSSSVNRDETGHNRDGKKAWMWGIMASSAAYFTIVNSRGKKIIKTLMNDFMNVVISDRYAAYNYFDSSHRQLCWAHLKRDFTKLSEKSDKMIAEIGKQLLILEAELFKKWYEFKAGALSRDRLIQETAFIRRRVGEYLEQGSYTAPELKASRFCKHLLDDFQALWTFLRVEQVEPTNNHAERCLRHGVIWRNKYFCTRSDYGSEFVARSLSVMMTCKLQSKNTFQFLCKTLHNAFTKTPPPSLVDTT